MDGGHAEPGIGRAFARPRWLRPRYDLIARRANVPQLISTPNQRQHPRYPVPARGAARDRHGRWERDAMDAAASGAQSARGRMMLQRTAKSCGPGAPTLALSRWYDPLMTVAKEPGHREEHEGNR